MKNVFKKNKAESKAKISKPSEIELSKKDSNAAREGAKHRVSFLVGQSFRGNYYKAGDEIILSEGDAKAYAKRSTLKIEPL